MAGLGVYVQIPFCASKCTFCNFSSGVAPETVFEGYCRAVEREATDLASNLRGIGACEDCTLSPVDTIYFGGGTPPIVGTERLGAIVTAIQRHLRVEEPVEFTIEATPGSLDGAALRALGDLGVNRLSIGAQSFVDKELESVGRLHTAQETAIFVQAARALGFRNISLDLIAGLPHQTEESWRRSLETAANLRPEHMSIYIFEMDEKSRLGAEVLKHGSLVHAGAVPDENCVAQAYETARHFLGEHGYRQYEISNFALPGFESSHNRKYWQLDPYIGLGAGAHSFDGEHRWSNFVSPSDYETKVARGEVPIADFRQLSSGELIEEFFFTGLRQATGVDLAVARCRWGAEALGRWEPVITGLVASDMIERSGEKIRLFERAYLISNEIFQEFLTAQENVESA